jgi:hypothetical protein
MLICVICNEECELELLETAHLIPRCGTSNEEKYDPNIVEFFCLFCHKFYDAGKIGILDGKIQIKNIKKELYKKLEGKTITCYKEENKKYFDNHYQNIYNKNIII